MLPCNYRELIALRYFSKTPVPEKGRKLATRREAEKHKALQDYISWKKDILPKLSEHKGQYWLGEIRPFPFNRAFKPAPIIIQSVKEKIFKESVGSNEYALAQKYGISLARLRAIIKLGNLQQSSDKDLMDDFKTKMEQVMFKEDVRNGNWNKDREYISLASKPEYKIVPDGVAVPQYINREGEHKDCERKNDIIIRHKNWIFKDFCH